MAETVRRALCRWCHSQCRVVVHSENGKLVKIEEDRTDPRVDHMLPRTRGCLRLAGAKEYIYHPDRVRFPLKRKGARGENKWEQISWEEALSDISSRLKELGDMYGPETLMMTYGTGRSTTWVLIRFLNLFGSPNLVGQATICFGPMLGAAAAMFGWTLRHRTHFTIGKGADGRPITRCALVAGMDPSQAYHRLWKSLTDGKKDGTKIIVVDPRRTRTAELADMWLQLRPGTDTALFMSMTNVVIEEGLYDKEFVRKWCYGFDKLAERVKPYSPEKASEITWIPAEQIRQAARLYATMRPGISVNGMGTEHLEDQQQAIQARLILAAIVGNIDVEGGDYIPGPADIVSEAEMQLSERLSSEQRKKQLGIDKFRLLSWPGRELISEANKKVWGRESATPSYAHYPSVLRAAISGEPYPVKAGITIASNPMITQGNTKLVYKALKSLELYVVKDFWLTPGAQLADYVLPSACWAERPDLLSAFGSDTRVIAGEAALPAKVRGEHEYYTDYDFFKALGTKMGQGKDWRWKSLEEVYDYQLKPMGLNLREFMDQRDGVHFPPNEYKKYEKKGGFGTPTGKLELYCTILEELGYDPLPEYKEPKESPISRPDLAKDYPLMLISGGRFQPYFHSEHRQIESIRRRRPEPRVQIHPDTAKRLGIGDGDWVWIESPRGTVKQRCTYFDGIDPRVVHGEHGWWFPEFPGEEPWLRGVWESNINVLTGDDLERCDERSGGWPLKTALCRVYKCKTPAS
jgi:thiosulfate reductase/polysulfide reductase chain A